LQRALTEPYFCPCHGIAPIYAWFSEGVDRRDLIEAKALLEELSS
jgi:hypothetical protein